MSSLLLWKKGPITLCRDRCAPSGNLFLLCYIFLNKSWRYQGEYNGLKLLSDHKSSSRTGARTSSGFLTHSHLCHFPSRTRPPRLKEKKQKKKKRATPSSYAACCACPPAESLILYYLSCYMALLCSAALRSFVRLPPSKYILEILISNGVSSVSASPSLRTILAYTMGISMSLCPAQKHNFLVFHLLSFWFFPVT